MILPTVQGQMQALSSAQILAGIQKLNTVGSVLYVAAHPDDENTRLLAYLSNERKMRTAYLSLTRGDGGQNLIGKEQGAALGLIRTNELLAARAIDGAEQFFTRANDFGYSKNPDETFEIWNKQEVLADVVWAIRKFRPEIIICRFPTTGEGGHGHHTASAILAQEAFDAAANPKMFVNQLQYVTTWQAKRLFWNIFNFGGNNTTADNQIKVDVGLYNVLMGAGYGEIAANSRSNHKSQGFGSARGRGSNLEYFKQLKGDNVNTDILEGIDITWTRFNANNIRSAIEKCIAQFDALAPDKSITTLLHIYQQLQLLDTSDAGLKYWQAQKTKEVTQLIFACAGLWVEAAATEFTGIAGNAFTCNIQAINRSNAQVYLKSITITNDTLVQLPLQNNVLFTVKHTETLPSTIAFSNPYWLNETGTYGLFNVQDQQLIGQPLNKSNATVTFNLTINQLPFTITQPVVYKYTDPVKGEVYRPFEILPPATVNMADKVCISANGKPVKVSFVIKANKHNVSGKLLLRVPKGWQADTSLFSFNLTNKNDELIFEAILKPGTQTTNGILSADLEIEGKKYNQSIQRINYDHIPNQFILTPAETKLVKLNCQTGGKKVAYINGAGDEVADCLKQLGFEITTLEVSQISKTNLHAFDAIITGVRAYNVHDDLPLHYQQLMDYIKQGGNLIVQYNTNSRVGPVKSKIGPYPFTISRDRVTNENAAVNFITPHIALQQPNKIATSDFENWVQERGIYFATEVDSNYVMPLSMADPNEKASNGSLLIAPYGKGNFVYTGLAFFRQLPAGNTGAYRLIANLLALPKHE
ncbi:MAG: PIG-L family deacetylase [Bacteroidia bacterium]|nr:PIG-L family deacetylase [Bacteroidia bacterium]